MSTALRSVAVVASITGLALVNWGIANSPVDISPISTQQSRETLFGGATGGVEDNQNAALSEPLFVETFSRPLFARSRRPWEPPQAPPPPQRPTQTARPVARQIEPPDFSLIGISMAGAAAKALLRRHSEFEAVWVSEGETVGGWIVGQIDSQSITVRQDDQTVSMALYPEIPESGADQ